MSRWQRLCVEDFSGTRGRSLIFLFLVPSSRSSPTLPIRIFTVCRVSSVGDQSRVRTPVWIGFPSNSLHQSVSRSDIPFVGIHQVSSETVYFYLSFRVSTIHWMDCSESDMCWLNLKWQFRHTELSDTKKSGVGWLTVGSDPRRGRPHRRLDVDKLSRTVNKLKYILG